MPAAPAAPPPQSSVNIIDTGPPKPPPAPTSEIRVSGIPSSATPEPPPAKGSAKESLFADLRKKAGAEQPAADKPKVPEKSKESPPTTSPEDDTQTPNEESSTHPEDSSPKPETKPVPEKKEGKAGKPNPWKLADEYKARAAKAEQELLETKKQLVPEQDRKSWEDRLKKTEARNKELEDEIRFTNYEKSAEFVKDFQKPYEDAFTRAMADLKEVPIKDPNTGNFRSMTADDLAQLGFMSGFNNRTVSSSTYESSALTS